MNRRCRLAFATSTCLAARGLAGCGGANESDTSGKLVKSDASGLQRTKIDPKTGLQFEVYSSPQEFGGGSTLTVRPRTRPAVSLKGWRTVLGSTRTALSLSRLVLDP